MKNFDIKRFGQLLRYDAVTYNRSYLKYGIGIFLCHLIMQMLVTYGMTNSIHFMTPDTEVTVYATDLGVAFAFTIIMLAIAMSLAFANLSTKPGRISYLMLPVSNLEKFLSRVLIFSIGFVIANTVAFVLADLLRMLLLFYMDGHVGLVMSYIPRFCQDVMDGTTKIYTFFSNSDDGVWPLIFKTAYGILAPTFICLMFLLGGICFKKAAFVKTSVIMLLLSFLLGLVRVNLGSQPIRTEPSTFRLAISAFISLIFVAGAVWLCYHAFKKVTVVSRKWF